MSVALADVRLAANAVERGMLAAQRLGARALQRTDAFATVEGWITQIAAVEEQLELLRARLERMRDRGEASAQDFATFDLHRDNVYRMQVKADRALRDAFGRVPGLLARLPRPVPAPSVSRVGGSSGLRGVRGALGNPAAAPAAGAAAGAGVALSPWFWAAIVVAVVLAVIVVAVMLGGSMITDSVRDVAVNHDYLTRQAEVWARREAHVRACVEAGGAHVECANAAVRLFPQPRLARLPEPHGWVKWVAGAVIVLVVAGAGLYLYRELRPRRRRELGATAKYRDLTPSQFLSSDGGRYGMEID